MKIKSFLSLILISGILLFSGCHKKNKEFQKDVAGIGEAMCRNMEVMNKLKATNPIDTISIKELQMKAHDLQTEMTILYTEFKQKYGNKMTDPAFVKDFGNEIKKSMLNCKYLSKEDREKYEKEIE